MVTILEPREVIPAQPAPAPEAPPVLTAQRWDWGYMVPCAGVRYYTCRALGQPQPINQPRKEARPVPAFLPVQLPVQLLDERVILL